MNKHELYHSEIYLGKDFSDGIKHWKYLKREKVNGKWRYYYSNDELNKAKKDLNNANVNTLKVAAKKVNADNEVKYAQEKVKKAQAAMKDLSDTVNNRIGSIKLNTTNYKNVKNDYDKALKEKAAAISNRNKVNAEADKVSAKADEIYRKYQKTAIKSIPSKVIATGMAKVLNAISDLPSKFSKAVKWFKDNTSSHTSKQHASTVRFSDGTYKRAK